MSHLALSRSCLFVEAVRDVPVHKSWTRNREAPSLWKVTFGQPRWRFTLLSPSSQLPPLLGIFLSASPSMIQGRDSSASEQVGLPKQELLIQVHFTLPATGSVCAQLLLHDGAPWPRPSGDSRLRISRLRDTLDWVCVCG